MTGNPEHLVYSTLEPMRFQFMHRGYKLMVKCIDKFANDRHTWVQDGGAPEMSVFIQAPKFSLVAQSELMQDYIMLCS